jgi:asparagine synthase (glutamine-hydrolysing)
MSAIYGILGDADLSELSAMGNRLAHRGNGTAEWSVAPGVLFGRRDRSADGRIAVDSGVPVTLDGFIDNRAAIAAALGLKPHEAADDRALVAAICERDGADALGMLRGQFGVAIYDGRTRTLTLGRDRWGARSVYYARHAGCLVFASEYKALLAFRDLPARPNLEAIQYVQCTMHGHPGACFLAGVDVVRSGSWVAFQEDRVNSKRYWDVAIRIAARSEADHAASVRTGFLEALREQTESKHTIGVALSGGLDSALVVAGMHHVVSGKPIHTFTAGFGPEDPEMIGAGQVARHFGTTHHEILMPPESLGEVVHPMVWHMEDTVGHEETAYLYVTAREAARHVDTLFSGRKADMLFAGMPRHKLIKLAIALPPLRSVLREFYNFTQSGRPPRSPLARMLVAGYYRGPTMPPAHVLGIPDFPPPDPLPLGIAEPLNQKLRRDVFDEPVTMTATERLHSAFALHSNSPFMDFRMIDRAFEIPDRLKIRGLRQKHILRVACRGLLPEGVLARKKSLQRLRHDEALSEALEQLAGELLTPSAVTARGFFSREHVARVLRRRPGAAYSSMQIYRVWSLLLAEIWARLFLDRRGAPLEIS